MNGVSLFAGIEGFGLALARAGIHVSAAVEIDPACRGVIGRHFPSTTLFGDITEVTGDQLTAAGFVPGTGIITGGFPCQDLSIAGRRTGLGGARSGLFWEIMRLADELRPRWLLLENVPGLLSAVCSCPGDDTCTVNGRAVRCGTEYYVRDRDGVTIRLEFAAHVPHAVKGGACADGCMERHGGAMGTVLGALGERGYGYAYRVLDAQFFGVPQRRERVFIAGCAGDWAAPVQVLLEPESGDRDPAACGPARAGAAGSSGNGAGDAGTVGTLPGTASGGWRIGADEAAAGHLAGWGTNHGQPGHGGKDDAVIAVTHAITARERKGADSDATSGIVVVPLALRGRDGGSQAEVGEPGDPSFTVRTPGGGSSYPMVAHALTSEGADASEDGTGRSTPLVAVTLTSGGTNPGGRRKEDDFNLVTDPVTFNWQSGGDVRLGVSDKPGALSANQTPAVATTGWQGGSNQDQILSEGDIAPTLAHSSNAHQGHHQPKVFVSENQRGELLETGYAHQLTTGGGKPGQGYPAIREDAAVRRLTPRECERLQGFPDDWTRWLADGTEQSDSARYRQCGNAVAVPVVEWIVRRIAEAA